MHFDVASAAGPPMFRIVSALCPHYSRSLSALFPQHLRNRSALFPQCPRPPANPAVFPHCFRSLSALFPHSFRTVSAVFPHCFRSLSAPVSAVVCQSQIGYTAGCSSCLIKCCRSINKMAELQTTSVPRKDVGAEPQTPLQSSKLRQMLY